jgi:hypothetical protein
MYAYDNIRVMTVDHSETLRISVDHPANEIFIVPRYNIGRGFVA